MSLGLATRALTPLLWLGLALGACSGSDGTSGADSGGGVDTADTGVTGDGGADDTGVDDGGAEDTGDEVDCSELRWITDVPVVLDSQTAADAFCAAGNAVEGDLYLDVGTEEDPITELDGVDCLCEVTGDLTITGDSSQTPPPTPLWAAPVGPPPPHVTGDIELELLERVGGDLILSHHPSLDFVQSLASLSEVGGDIVLEDIPNLQVIKFFGLETVGGTITVTDMGKLLVFGISAATSIGGLELGETDDAETLYFLVEVGMEALQEVTGDLKLVGARNLGNLQAPELVSIGGALHLEGTCTTSPSFASLTSVGSLTLHGNCDVEDFDGFAQLAEVTGSDADGNSVVITQNAVSAEAASAFVAGLELSGGGAVEVDTDADCTEVVAGYGEGYCG